MGCAFARERGRRHQYHPTRLELVTSAMRIQQSLLLCFLTSSKFRLFKPNSGCRSGALFCCVLMFSTRVAARLLHLQRFAGTLDYPALRGIDASVEELHGKIRTSSNVACRRAKWSGPTS